MSPRHTLRSVDRDLRYDTDGTGGTGICRGSVIMDGQPGGGTLDVAGVRVDPTSVGLYYALAGATRSESKGPSL
jgi:hypothetical protein